MADTLRIGIIGYGFATKTFHAPVINATPGLTLAAVSSSDAGKVHVDWPEITVVDDPQQLIHRDDVDAIVIPTPNDTHFPLAREALLAGKHVVVDKPFTVTLSQAHELNQRAQARGRLLSVFHNRRWDSDFLTLQQLVKDGTLREIGYLASHYDRFRLEVRDRWRERPGAGSGIWFDLGAHLIDQMLTLFGMPVVVNTDLAQLRPGAHTTNYFHAVLICPQCRVVLHGTLLAAVLTPRFVVHGTRGSYIKYGFDSQEDSLKAGERPGGRGWGTDKQDGVLTLIEDSGGRVTSHPTLPRDYPAYYQGILAAVRGAAPNPVPAEEAIRVMETLEPVSRAPNNAKRCRSKTADPHAGKGRNYRFALSC